MKKILFSLVIFTVLFFTACSIESDCECKWIMDEYNEVFKENPFTFYVRNYEGDCNDVDWDHIPIYNGEYIGSVNTTTLKCTDK
ncbi:MAG: hypothetical protein LBM25_01730 [Bacteroidales bacterium]|jgi:hypothetical protein|nr:hypothetical protein [Bacteroidales bacterium]